MSRLIALAATCISCVLVCGTGVPQVSKWDVGIRDGYLRGIEAVDVWSAADRIGVTQIEAAVDPQLGLRDLFEGSDAPYSLATPDALARLKAKLVEQKKSICAFTAVYNLDGKQSEADAVAWIGVIAEAAKELGVPAILVPVPGGKGMTDAAFIERGKSFLARLVPIAEKTGVHLALENLQLFWNRIEVLEPVLGSLPKEHVGLSHDAINMYWYGHPVNKVYEMTERVAPYVRRYCHAKNNSYPPDQKNIMRTPPGSGYGESAVSIREGDLDFHRILDLYAKAGFRGVVTIEDDSLAKHDAAGKRAVLIDDVKFLREIIAELEQRYP
jgi:sugar phosphate isomerase/epimerase